jgi:hypothetical protein
VLTTQYIMIVQKLFALQQPPFSCTKSSYGSKKFSTKQNSLSTSADSAYCQAIVYLTEAIIFHGQCFWVEKFSTSTAYGTKVLCLTEVSLLVHGQYLHGSKSFLTYWGSPLRLRTVLTIPSCFSSISSTLQKLTSFLQGQQFSALEKQSYSSVDNAYAFKFQKTSFSSGRSSYELKRSLLYRGQPPCSSTLLTYPTVMCITSSSVKSAYGSKKSCASQKPCSSSAYNSYGYKSYVPYRSSSPRLESPYRSKSSALCRSHFHPPWTILTGPKVMCLTEANLVRIQYLWI